MTMKNDALVLLAISLAGRLNVSAFAPRQQSLQKLQTATRHEWHRKQTRYASGRLEEDADQTTNSFLDDEGTLPISNDVGQEIFMANVGEMGATAEILSEFDSVDPNESLQTSLKEMMAESNNDQSPLPTNVVKITVMDELSAETAFLEKPQPLDQEGVGMVDAVEELLSASEEAIASVEATFAPAVEEEPPSSVIIPASPELIATSPRSPEDQAHDNAVVESIMASSDEAVAAAEASFRDLDNKLTTIDAPSVDETQVETTSFSPPPVKRILKFAVPAIGVWLCSPLLSLIDTSTVGILSGTTQQAALNPAVAVTDYAALLIAFLYTGTTNLIAAARETDRSVEGSPRTTDTLVGAMQLSTWVGLGLGTILFTFARPLLRAIIGNDGISPAVFAAAMKYVRIRALGMPAAAVIGSAQAACLGMQDIRSPLYVLLAAAVVNFCGDMLFVGCRHAWVGGAAGAAWATVFSQYAALGLFVHWLSNKPRKKEAKVVNLSDAIFELTGKPSSSGSSRRRRFRDSLNSFRQPSSGQKQSRDNAPRGFGQRITSIASSLVSKWRKQREDSKSLLKVKEESFSARGFLEGRFGASSLVKAPPAHTVDDFKPYILPVTSTQVGRVSGYVAMSHVVASSLGCISMAAQQVIVSLFYCLCPIADSLSLTAQSFVPAISERKVSVERAKALRETVINFLKAGGVFGAVMVAAVSCIPLLSGFFTTDPAVVTLVNKVAPLLIGFFAVHGFVCSSEGLLLGRKDLSFLGRMYAGFFAVVPWLMLRVKRAALAGKKGVDLTSVWNVFLGYQMFRCAVWSVRLAILQRRTNQEANKLAIDDSL